MPHTTLLASGLAINVPEQTELVQLDVSAYRTIRLSAGNWAESPGPVVIYISQIDQPDTPNANAIVMVDSFTLAPEESASKVYEILGEVVEFMAEPEDPAVAGIVVFFTIYGWTD